MELNKTGSAGGTGGDAWALHEKFIEQLKAAGKLDDPAIEDAFRSIPRHLFLPDMPPEDVYRDAAIPVKMASAGEAISSSSQPSLMASMLQQAELRPGQRILEIGTATGYNAALLAHIVGPGGEVVTIDIDQDLIDSAREHLQAAGYPNVKAICADGGYGYAEGGPFDRIILTVGASDIAPAWWDQLKPDGLLLIPLTIRGQFQRMIALRPRDGYLESVSAINCLFVGLRGDYKQADRRQIQIGPEPGIVLHAGSEGPEPDPDAVHRLLTGPHRDIPVGISTNEREIGVNLLEWLTTHDPGLIGIQAMEELADSGIVPYLFGIAGKSCFSTGLCDSSSLALLMREPSAVRPTEPKPQPENVELWIRSFGDEPLAEELRRRIIEWDSLGRPNDVRMRVRAYRKGDEVPTGDELRIEKKHSTLLIDWNG